MQIRKFIALLISIIITGCAPSFSEFQGADLVGKGNIEVTPYTSETNAEETSDDGMSGTLQDSKGFRLSYGLNEKLDVQMEYETIEGQGGYVDGSIMSVGMKYKLYSNDKLRFSGCLPLSKVKRSMTQLDLFGGGESESESEDQEFTLIEPTILASYKVLDFVDINVSAKILKIIDGDDIGTDEHGYAFNLSGSLSLSKFVPIPNINLTVIPEYGVLDVDGDKFNHSGIGLAIKYIR